MNRRIFLALFIAILACGSVNVWASTNAKSKKKKSNSELSEISKKMHGVWMMQCTKTENDKDYKPMEGFMKVYLEDGSFTNFQVAKGGATTSLSGRFEIMSKDTYSETFEYRINDELAGNENVLKFHFDGPNKLHLYWKLNIDDGTTKGEILVEEIWVKVTTPKAEKAITKEKKKK